MDGSKTCISSTGLAKIAGMCYSYTYVEKIYASKGNNYDYSN